jgi:phosphoribosylformylglycinamidine cyclo-ligase
LALTYVQAGVDIGKGDRLVKRIKRSARSTFSRSVLRDIGAFGAFFDARFPGYTSPVLVSSVDGVGTKLKIAQLLGKHDTIGEDLVNHCVNDILVCGAQPLFFLDYFATGSLNVDTAESVIRGFARACKQNGCSLIGGETAEMPGIYAGDDYDLAGTIVGVVERKAIVDGRRIRKGDVLVGLPSTGLHTNGYSLARRVLLEKYSLTDYLDELGTTLGHALLAVHRSYLGIITTILKKVPVHGLAHITGGGIRGNTMRIVPQGLHLNIDWEAWDRPPLFRLIQRAGRVPEADMRRTFNLGIGLVVVIPRTKRDALFTLLNREHETGYRIGEVVSSGA